MRIQPKAALPPLAALRSTRWEIDLVADGFSMEPLIRAGDTVTIACHPVNIYNPGDIICFQRGQEFVLHRLIEINSMQKQFYFEKGDAETGGQWIHEDGILGRLIKINGRALDSEYSQYALRFSKFEQRVAGILRRLGFSPIPAGMRKVWLKFKRCVCQSNGKVRRNGEP